jgi:hypothetical protein
VEDGGSPPRTDAALFTLLARLLVFDPRHEALSQKQYATFKDRSNKESDSSAIFPSRHILFGRAPRHWRE